MLALTPYVSRGEYARSGFGRENERERERMSEGSGRAEMERRLIEKSLEDEAFRQRLIEDPKGAVEQELGTRLPEEVRVVKIQSSAEPGSLPIRKTLRGMPIIVTASKPPS